MSGYETMLRTHWEQHRAGELAGMADPGSFFSDLSWPLGVLAIVVLVGGRLGLYWVAAGYDPPAVRSSSIENRRPATRFGSCL